MKMTHFFMFALLAYATPAFANIEIPIPVGLLLFIATMGIAGVAYMLFYGFMSARRAYLISQYKSKQRGTVNDAINELSSGLEETAITVTLEILEEKEESKIKSIIKKHSSDKSLQKAIHGTIMMCIASSVEQIQEGAKKVSIGKLINLLTGKGVPKKMAKAVAKGVAGVFNTA